MTSTKNNEISLTKQVKPTELTARDLDIDAFIRHFVELHSWYKHLSSQGEVFYFWIGVGPQAGNMCNDDRDEKDQTLHFRYIRDSLFQQNKSTYEKVVFQDYPVVLNNKLSWCCDSEHQLQLNKVRVALTKIKSDIKEKPFYIFR